MISQSNLGRYECVDSSTNTKKYWHLMYDKTKGKYIAIWGRIGNRGQETLYEGDSTAMKKVQEKLKKGYVLKSGHETVIGNNAENFILSIQDREEAA
mgnify:CR=1 FL=1